MISKTLAIAAFMTLTLGAANASADEWTVDPTHASAQFSIKHMMVSTVRGTFRKVSGVVNLDDKDPTKSGVEVVIDAASIDTGEPKRDAHLKAADFFDVSKYPTLTFKSTRIEKASKGKFKVTGDLTMHGQTHPLTLLVEAPSAPIKTPWGTVARGVSATGTLNRKDWGLTWNKAIETGGVVVGEEVQLQIDAELNPKQGPQAQK
jgi:polyisoprenoid-binding protein YceI